MTNIDPGWCREVLSRLEGFTAPDASYPPSYRTNDRWVSDDPALAADLFARLELSAVQHDAEGNEWRLAGLNPRMRACRYREGQWFGIHRDGVCWRSARERSFLSVLVYLDEGFEGGATRFFGDRSGRVITRQIEPAIGQTAVFDHALWHDGAPVVRGVKHVLRTDVMYERAQGASEGHLGYVWSLALVGARLASGGRDRTIRLWRDGRLRSTQVAHEASVTCLAAIDAQTLVSGSRDHTIRRWRMNGDEIEAAGTLPGHDGAVLSLLACEGRVISGGADGVVAIEGGARERRHDGWVWGLARTSSGAIASVGEDGVLWIGDRRVDLQVPLLCVASFGDRLLVGANDGSVFVVTDRAIGRRAAHDGPVTCVTALSDGGFATGGEDDRVRRWSASGELIDERRHGDFVRALIEVPGAGIVSAGYDGIIGQRRFARETARSAPTATP